MNNKKSILVITIIGIALLLLVTTIILANRKTNWVTDQDFLYSKAIDYIISENKKEYYNNEEDYQVFTDYKGFGISENKKKNEKYAYMYVLVESYYTKKEKIRSDVGSSMPYKFTFNENNEIINCEIPENGNRYAKSIIRIFPNDIENEVLSYTFDDTKLRNDVKEHYSYLASTDIVHTDYEEFPIVICGMYGGYTSKAEANTIKGKYIDGYGDVYEYTIPCNENEELRINIDEITENEISKYVGEKVSTISKEDIEEIKNNLADIEDEYENIGIWAEDVPLSFVKVKYVKKNNLLVVDYDKAEFTDLIKSTNEMNISQSAKKILNILNKYDLVYTY